MKLDELRKQATESCKARNHEMVWQPPRMHTNRILQTAYCRSCNRYVQIDTKPEPNGIDIGGDAVAENCPDFEYNTFDWEVLENLNLTGAELANLMGISKTSFDPALPQGWLFAFVNEHRLDYDKVRYSTFYLYHPRANGVPVSACEEIDKLLREHTSHYPMKHTHYDDVPEWYKGGRNG